MCENVQPIECAFFSKHEITMLSVFIFKWEEHKFDYIEHINVIY